MLDVIDVTIEGGLFLVGTDQHRADADDAPASADGLDLLVRHVSLDVVIFSRIRVRDDDGPRRHFDDVVESGRADVSEIDDDANLFAFANHIAAERGQSIARRTAGGKKTTVPGRVAPHM